MKESLNKTFNHFKVHTQYSICEGALKIDKLKDFFLDCSMDNLYITIIHHNFTICHIRKISIVSCKN